MNILAISGSLRSSSSNTALLRAASSLAPGGMHITIYEGMGNLPHFSPEIDTDEPPAAVSDLRMRLRESDGVIICTPEYAFGVPGSLKNALDWTVSSGEFPGKPVAAISASPSFLGGDKAHASLLLTLTALGADIVAEGSHIIPAIRTKMKPDGKISDPQTAELLRSALRGLAQRIEEIRK